MEKKILLTDCPDAKGLIAKITNICYKHQLNINKNDEFVDHENGRFFMRTELEGRFNDETLLADLDDALPAGAQRRLVKAGKKRIVILVTKETHCLGDILMKNYAGALDMDIVAVIGNYDTLAELTGKFDIPFHAVSHEDLSRTEHEEQVLAELTGKFEIPFHAVSHEDLSRTEHEEQVRAIIDGYQPDYVILAKYMRVLTPSFVEAYPRKLINIHHSFLPAFIGARPYRQAFDRGVKLIGATAHFVTDDLDEGPIIEQDVIHVGHAFSADDMAKAGRDVEKSVLSRALELVLNERVFVYGNKTVVFK
ncbi:Formyltetrahydrofolate deformylase [compost metagenome]